MNELVANRIIDAEDLSAEELRVLEKFYGKLAEMAKKDRAVYLSHSIEEGKSCNKKKKRE
ncbi:low affinity iron permease family protein [Solitalea koreensis]|uniref:low affinity iron permease family protein n=1 Tax=Solitalea koreensis TaxID=543615 RepID=UPI001FEAC6EE|nr:low affinity iron permease family protein [Solitalea koreensis]